MEKQTNFKSSLINQKIHSSTIKDGKENLIRKRPSATKLDLEKIFQQSIELTQLFKKLSAQNNHLKSQYQHVQTAKQSRQALISMVQQIVKQKAKQLNKNPTNQSSWLVHKLNTKVYELKSKIEAKQKAIKEIQMSKQNEWIRQKQSQLQSINEALQHLSRTTKNKSYEDERTKDYNQFQEQSQEDNSILSKIKQIVWLQEQIKSKQDEIGQAEKIYAQEERQVRKTIMQISKKKAQLAQIKELQQQYYRTQQDFREQKKKKQQRLAGNKTYLDELIQSRHNQFKKLQDLKQKYQIIEEEQTKNIIQLQAKLQSMKKEYEEKVKARHQKISGTEEKPLVTSKQRWVKRVTFKEIKHIARNLNYFIALKRVSKDAILRQIFKKEESQLSIREVIEILEKYPFEIQSCHERQLLARYCIQDAGQGYFMEDMETSEAVPIIRSVLSKLIGDVRIYSQEEQQHLMKKTGELMHKFHSLIQQNIETKEGSIKKITKQIMEQGIIATELDLDADQINFVILYLFSWTHNIDELEISLLEPMLNKGVKWILKK